MNAGTAFGLRRRIIIWTLLAYAIVALCLGNSASAQGVVPTDNGPVRGVDTADVHEYLGIPYAAPPVGDLRWRPPQPHARWQTPRDASHFGNHCPQPASPFGTASETEDCLYLNVFTPNEGPGRGHTKNLPVMVWIHGGGLVVGESDDYDPTRLVEQGVVVVTFNYRLGLLGFLAHPALSAESGNGSGNYGLMDQQAALRWVQRNIAKFGGDPDNVTIFGQSAGGLSVHAQLASPLAAGLFDRAIAQSGAYALSLPSLASAESRGKSFADTVGCFDQTAACLRSQRVGIVVANTPTTEGSLLPNLDGNVLPRSIKAAFESGQFNRVPVTEGSTHDEFSIFYKTEIEDHFGVLPPFFYPFVVPIFLQTVGLHANPADVMALYPLSAYQNNVGLAVTALATDALFSCPGRRAAQTLSQFVPTFAYEFNDPNVPQIFVPPAASFPSYGSYHASELLSLFDSPQRGGHAPFTPDEEKLADAMIHYWTQFGRAGNPNSPATPFWPAYTVANDTYQSLEPPTPKPTTGFAADHKCAFWDAHG
jgi:para-nitrobenzyl esterase